MVNAVLAPTLAAEFGLSAGGLGLLSSMYFLSFAVCQLPVGVAMDRFGPRRVNAALLLVAAAGGTWFAYAESAASAIAARAVIGVGVSACLMASLTAFVLWYPPGRLSTMNAIAFSAGALGAMTTTVAARAAAAQLALAPGVHAHRRRHGGGEPRALALGSGSERATRRSLSATRFRNWESFCGDAAFIRIALCLGASQFASVALQTLWIATWLRDVAGYDAGAGGARVARRERVDDRRLPGVRPSRRRTSTGAAATCCRC